jgi:hypothetical protein
LPEEGADLQTHQNQEGTQMKTRFIVGWTALILGTALFIGLFGAPEPARAGNEQTAFAIAATHAPLPDTPTPGFTPAALGPNAVPERRPSLLVGGVVIGLVIVLGLVVHARQKANPE